MPKTQTTLSVCLCIAVAATTIAVAAPINELSRDKPLRYVPGWDGDLSSAEAAGGGEWTVWSYRNGDEHDIALALRDAEGNWQPTVFIGVDDGVDQLHPQMITDPSGHLYVAWIDRGGELSMAIHSAVGTGWSPPAVVAEGFRLGWPTMAIVGDRLVIGYRDGGRVSLIDLPLLDQLVAEGAFGLSGLHDVPDPVTSENPYRQGRKDDPNDDLPIDDEEDSPYTVGPN